MNFRLGSAGEPNVCSHCYDVLNEEMGNEITYPFPNFKGAAIDVGMDK